MLNEEILQKLLKSVEETNKKTIQEANNNQTREIQTYINSEILELKQKIKEELQTSVLEWENKYQDLRLKYLKLEKELRKNNLIVFGVENTPENLPVYVSELLSKLLKINVSVNDINNVYTIGKQSQKKPIILKLVSYLKKQEILRNAKNLKGTNVSISEELTLEERQENRILRQYLRKARDENQNAYIKNKKLVVNGEEYTAKELADGEEDSDTEEAPAEENPNSNDQETIVQKSGSDHSPKPANHRSETKDLSKEEEDEEIIETEEVGETKKRKIVKVSEPLQKLQSSSKLGNSDNYSKKIHTRSCQSFKKNPKIN